MTDVLLVHGALRWSPTATRGSSRRQHSRRPASRSTRTAATAGDVLPPPPPELVGVTDPHDAAMLRDRLTDQPWATFDDPLHLPGPWLRCPAHAVVCDPPSGIPFEQWAADRGVPVQRLKSGHDAMITVPHELARVLAGLLDAP